VDDFKPGASKSALYRMLDEAMANTVALQEGRPLVRAKPPVATLVPKPPKNAPASPTTGRPPKAIKSTKEPPTVAMPTADQVARAIIAAAAETGEDAVACATGEERMRCRHYAMHALAHVFQGLSRQALARMVGRGDRADRFWRDSWNQAVKPPAHGRGHMANWWNEGAYARVIEAITGGADSQTPT
jgi:hypothetical protein